MITYILLSGRRPFWDKTEGGIFREVLRNRPDFRRKPWPTVSDSAKDFVRKLLVKNPLARLTAAQALCISFFPILYHLGLLFSNKNNKLLVNIYYAATLSNQQLGL